MITIGTDPEFLLVDRSGSIRGASNYDFFYSTSSSSEIGRDGAGTPVEIRPRPSNITEIDILCDNIKRLFRKVAKYCHPQRLKLYAGANYKGNRPIGGHIHFGSPEMRRSRHREKLIHVLDTHWTPIINHFLPSRHIATRVNSGYGKLGSWESKSYGFEYRTPWSFLMSPYLTRVGFSLASLLAYHYKKIPYDYDLFNDVWDYYKHLDDTKRLKNIYSQIKPKILNLMSYKSINKQHNGDILSMFNLIEQKRECKCREVFKNFKMESGQEYPFEVVYGPDDMMDYLRTMIRSSLKNTGKGEVYLYGVGERKEKMFRDKGTGERTRKRDEVKATLKPTIFLSKDMPKPKYLRKCRVEYQTFGSGSSHRNSIGLSYILRKEIVNGKRPISFLLKYLNNLDFKNQETEQEITSSRVY